MKRKEKVREKERREERRSQEDEEEEELGKQGVMRDITEWLDDK